VTIALQTISGRFIGRGINHDKLPFTGLFTSRPVKGGQGIAITFEAIGDDGAVFHAESSLIGRNLSDRLALTVLSSNHPAVFERPLRRTETTSDGTPRFVFGFGDPADQSQFREEVALEVTPDSIRYTYSWGLPDGAFAERSGCLMKRAE